MLRLPLLDLGNVILKVNFEPFFQWVVENSETKDPLKIKSFLSSSLFFDYEFGNIDRKEFIARTEKLFRGHFPATDFEHRFCDIFPGYVDGMQAAIENLLQNGPVYCLSNTNELHLSAVRERFPLLNQLSKIFASHEIRKRKPYPGIYREVANSLALQPRSLVFFDDLSSNIYGAERAGLESHLFINAEHLLSTMKQNPKEET